MTKKITLLYYYVKYRYFSRFKHREALESWQKKKIQRHLKWIVKRSRYYRELYAQKELFNFSALPVISKEEMMHHFTELNTVGIVREEAEAVAIRAEKERQFDSKVNGITVGLSSGTSGNRGVFLASDRERYMWSGAILAKTLPNGLFSKEKIAFFLRANSNLYETVKSRRLSFQYFDTFAELEANLEALNAFQPSILVAPASQLRFIAEAVQSGKIHLSCKKIISVAEVLETVDREYMSAAFGQRIDQVYQATEGFLASTCEYGTLHMNEDIVHIDKEYIDPEHNRFIPIITDFTRLSQPILRYRLNDVLVEDKQPCPCGSCFTAISHIEGRSDDVFYGLSRKTQQPVAIFSDFIRRAMMFASSHIEEYRVVQSSFMAINVYVRLKEEGSRTDIAFEKIIKELEAVFESFDCSPPIVTFDSEFTLKKGQKLRRLERTFKIDE